MSRQNRILTILQGLFVTFLWSSSYVLIKIGLSDVSPLFFATVRYSIAFLVLFLLNVVKSGVKLGLERQVLIHLIAAGITGYTLGQGLQFVGLSFLPAVSVTFLLNFTPLFVIVMEMIFLKVKILKTQLLGIILALVGAYVYFPIRFSHQEVLGVTIVLFSGMAWAAYMVLTRSLQKNGKLGSLAFTTLTMGVGCLGLVALTLFFEEFGSIGPQSWVIILWMSIVNTALAFFVWNRALRLLRAYELSILQNTMLAQISVLAYIFLVEKITGRMIVGIILVLIGASLVQVRKKEVVISAPRGDAGNDLKRDIIQ